MKNITQLTIALLLVFTTTHAQSELWGYKVIYNYLTPTTPGTNDGMIIKTGIAETSQEPGIMHTFDVTGLQGKFPKGRLFQASNGKLYGTTGYDESNVGQGIPPGVLFEYDPVLDRYKVLYNNLTATSHGVIEPLPGMLYGITDGGSSVFKYNINTEEFSIVATIPPFVYNFSNTYPKLIGELMKASDGNLYGVTSKAPSTQNIPYPGGIYKLNLTTGQISKVYVFGTLGSDVTDPVYETKLVEGQPGKLYGTSLGGSHVGPQGVAPIGSGTLFEYTIATATMVKKFDFDYATIGAYPSPVIKSGNKLYGTLSGRSNPGYPNMDGLVFEYDLTAGTLQPLHIFSYENDDFVKSPYGFLTKATDGNIYGSCMLGSYKLDPVSNTVTKKINATVGYDARDLIEICRKPAYRFFETASLVKCQNTPFEFDVQNTNATTYVWKKGSTVLPAQTTGILTIANLTVADTGIYTCTMTNSCGTTVTMPLQLTVNGCLGLDEAISLENAIKLYPNPATDILNLKLPDVPNFDIQHISITNMLGQTVYSAAGKTTSIAIDFLKTGLYQLLLTTDKGNWNGRFVKE